MKFTIASFGLLLATILIPWNLPMATAQSQPEQSPEVAREPDSHSELIVHEWGTWTELQDLEGISVGGINTDDEPVPAFVHRVGNVLEPTVEQFRNSFRLSKGVRFLENVRTRLETPVIYFYPPTTREKSLTVSVDVQLRGGWLSEFYPYAKSMAPGLSHYRLGEHMAGSLQWPSLEIGAKGSEAESKIPLTDEHVWLAPRKTEAALVRSKSNIPQGEGKTRALDESEHYVFYRGVGNFAGPLKAVTDLATDSLTLHSSFYRAGAAAPLQVDKLWLVSVESNGDLAFRTIDGFQAPHDRPAIVADFGRDFEPEEHNSANLQELHREMHRALVADGLYDDEATAMLTTWRDAYFKSPGLRLFYMVPQEWTDDRMPLTLSANAELQRVMIGRIELYSDQHLATVAKMKRQTPANNDWKKALYELKKEENALAESANKQQETKDASKQIKLAWDWLDNTKYAAVAVDFWRGANNINELEAAGIEIPASYKSYMQLGRFRNAILRHQALKTGDANLLQFLRNYGLMTSTLSAKYPLDAPAVSQVLK
ncbi:MAG: hypothetical protein AAF483_27995 [Planctomycetota bacterium]